MQTHNLIQGNQDWVEFRATHYGASETAAMLGLSKQLSRNDLLLFKKTGKSKEYSDWVQKNILDYGHEVEDTARVITETTLDTDLFPVTCSSELLSASCDGLTFDGMTAWEHKQWSEGLVKYITDNGTVPDTHMPQCQQILLVTGAKELIFTVSDGTENKRISCPVAPCKEWFDRITAGWDQFTRDLETFEPKEFADKPEPEAIMQLPALSIQIKGEVTVSNLPQFKAAADTFIANIKTDLKTDEDFVNAEATVRFCGETEDKLEAAKAAAIGQTASIDELMRTIDHIKESIRQKRLTLEKAVKSQKDKIKEEIIDDACMLCEHHVDAIHDELIKFVNFGNHAHPAIWSRRNFETACKNKRTLSSLHNAVDTEVAAIKIKLDDLARVIRKNLTHLPEDLSLFRDLQSIVTKSEDDFKLLVESRLAEQKRKEEEAKKRAEEAIKEAEERGRAQAAAAAERERIVKENETKRIQEEKDAQAKRAEQEAQAKASMEAYQAEVKRKEEAARAADAKHREKILSEASQSLFDYMASAKGQNLSASQIIELISVGNIRHITINF